MLYLDFISEAKFEKATNSEVFKYHAPGQWKTCG